MSKILIALLTLGLSASAFAGPHGRGGGGMHMNPKMMKELNLTDEQRTKIKALRKEAKAKIAPLKDQMKAAHEELKKAFESDASADTLKAIQAKVQGLKNQMGTAMFEQMLAVREILTPEQRKKAHGLFKEGRDSRKDHKEDHDNE